MSRKGKARRIGTPRSLAGGIRRMEAAASHGGKWAWVYQTFATHLERQLWTPRYVNTNERLTNEVWMWLILGWTRCPEIIGKKRYRSVLGVELLLRVLRIGRT